MDDLNVVWLPTVKEELLQFRSMHFTSEETFDFIHYGHRRTFKK